MRLPALLVLFGFALWSAPLRADDLSVLDAKSEPRKLLHAYLLKEAQKHSLAHTRDRIRLFVEEHRIR